MPDVLLILSGSGLDQPIRQLEMHRIIIHCPFYVQSLPISQLLLLHGTFPFKSLGTAKVSANMQVPPTLTIRNPISQAFSLQTSTKTTSDFSPDPIAMQEFSTFIYDISFQVSLCYSDKCLQYLKPKVWEQWNLRVSNIITKLHELGSSPVKWD